MVGFGPIHFPKWTAGGLQEVAADQNGSVKAAGSSVWSAAIDWPGSCGTQRHAFPGPSRPVSTVSGSSSHSIVDRSSSGPTVNPSIPAPVS